MKKENFLPEARCKITIFDYWTDPESHIGEIVHVLPQNYNYENQELNVFIGNSFPGIIPLSELSIYDFEEEKICYKLISPLFTSHNPITAKIIDFDNYHNCFILSRKENMKNALEYFLSIKGSSEIIYAYKTSTSKSSIFVDIGAGICGLIPCSEISDSYIDSSKYFNGIDYIPVHLLLENVYGKFVLSYKSTVSYQDFNVGDIVLGKVTQSVPTGDGIFIELNPNQTGILDADYGLLTTQCDNDNWFIIPNKSNNFSACCLKKNKKYYFQVIAIKYKGNKRLLKLSLV